MGLWDVGLAHLVDLDGQLLAIDAEVIETTSLLRRAQKAGGERLWLVHNGKRYPLHSKQLIRLAREEVVFLETSQRQTAAGEATFGVAGTNLRNRVAAGCLSSANSGRSS